MGASTNKKEVNTAVQAVDMEAIQKATAEIIAKAKAEAENILAIASEKASEIINEAVAKSTTNVSVVDKDEAKAKARAKADDDFWNELVEIRLFKDSGKYKDDVYVAVNGENCIIQRGKPVMVKRKFAQVLANSDSQDEYTADLIRQFEEDYENNVRRRFE